MPRLEDYYRTKTQLVMQMEGAKVALELMQNNLDFLNKKIEDLRKAGERLPSEKMPQE